MKYKLHLASLVCMAVAFNSSAQERITLEQVIALALEQNYDVRIAKQEAAAASKDYAYTVGGFLPQVNLIGATVWNQNEQELRFQTPTNDRSGTGQSNQVTASAQLSWTLFDGTRMFATRERIGVIAEQGELLVKDQMVNTIATIITNYYNIVRQ